MFSPRSALPATATARTALVAATLALTSLVSACGSGGDAAPTDVATASATEVTVPVSAVTATVLDPGAEPRQRVTVHPPIGSEQHATLTTRSQVYQQIDDQPQQDFSTPELRTPLTATVRGEQSDPAIQVDLTLGSIGTPDPRLSDALKESEGSGAGFTVQPTGAITSLRIAPDPDSRDIARSAVEQAFYQSVYRTVSFPDAEIGIGAVWTLRQQVMSGIALDQVTTATLRERDGDRLTVDVTVTQTPESPVWDLPDKSSRLNIDTYVMTGTGTMVVDLNQPLPVGGDVTVGGHQSYRDPNATTTLRQTITNRVQWAG
ncbi:hypothetical protein C8K38_11119 [Rhodococcus sp. OK611]|nr:hypothetical protein C8K38_11119 [Rhodococcus sp. OK611]SNX91697.1 hypothetical protein SAMN05447004_110238 [Rhodococcus sp. OK270]